MKRGHTPSVALLVAGLLSSGTLPAQSADTQQPAQLKRRMLEELGQLREESLSDNEAREGNPAGQEAFFGSLSGRFRIEGQIAEGSAASDVSGKITGVADCIGVGDGLGVHCVIGATWPVIDREVARIGARESASEILKAFNPAVLVLGLDPDQARVRSLLVTADSVSHGWVGRLEDHTMRANRVNECRTEDPRCYWRFEITADPQSEIVSLFLASRDAVNLTFTLHRDANARAKQKQKSLKAR